MQIDNFSSFLKSRPPLYEVYRKKNEIKPV